MYTTFKSGLTLLFLAILAILSCFSTSVDAASQAYWTEGKPTGNGKVGRANLQGSGPPFTKEDLIAGLPSPNNMALDEDGGKVYWADAGSNDIRRADLDGANIEILVTGINGVQGIALDLINGKMYWADFFPDVIQRASLDGSNVETLVSTGLSAPGNVALDITGGKMYWVDSGIDKIQRANLDGSSIEDIITGVDAPIGLTLDLVSGKMYWSDGGTKIQRANLDGSSIEDVLTGLNGVGQIALDLPKDFMYWTNANTGDILRAKLDGSGLEAVVTGLNNPIGIGLTLKLSVVIDIKPSSGSNPVNPRSKGVIPVAVLTTSTADGEPINFDATTVDALSAKFGPGEATEAHGKGHIEDVDNDGDIDLVLHFKTQQTGIQKGDTEASLTGETFDGQAITGTDAIRTAGKAKKPVIAIKNFPNPSNPATQIAYQLPEAGEVSLVIYNITGQPVRTLVRQYQGTGYYQVTWDGRDDRGREVSSGVYLYRFVSRGLVQTNRLMLLK